jgi:hypothetical protein
MNALAAPRLAVLTEQPAAPPVRRDTARARRIFGTMVVAGSAVSPLVMLLLPAFGELSYLWIGATYLLLLLPGGFGLLVAALVERTPAALRAFAAALVSLPLQFLLMGAAQQASFELYYGSHLAELDRLATTVREEQRAQLDGSNPLRPVAGEWTASQREALGIDRISVQQGMLIFALRVGSGRRLVLAPADGSYADAGCGAPATTPLGGRWYLVQCRGAADD